jgi:hypothetical protein
LRRWHEANPPKSAKRCAIATLPNQHESGTFRPAGAKRCSGLPKLPKG